MRALYTVCAIAFACTVACTAAALIFGCNPNGTPPTPTVAQQAGVATYTGALELCVQEALLRDAGQEAFYDTCAKQVDVRFGRILPDGGAP